MSLIESLESKKLTLSFEVFPPKPGQSDEKLNAAALSIARLRPEFISVTYGAGGSTSRQTLSLAEAIRRETDTEVLAHVTCGASSRDEIAGIVSSLRAAGIRNVMALRGDEVVPGGAFQHASELIGFLRSLDRDLCIGAACYPETHPESAGRREDIKYLREKVDAGCDFLTTQMFFDNNLLYAFLFHLREAGVRVPVIPGIMPITSATQVSRAVKLSNASIPQRFKSLVDRFGDAPGAMCQAGIAYATDQIIDLFANGICHVHVYTMNKPAVAKAIRDNLSEMLGSVK